MTRRESLQVAALALGCLCARSVTGAPPVETSTSSRTPELPREAYVLKAPGVAVDLAKAAALKSTGDAALIRDGSVRLVIIRTGRNTYRALSSACTHAGRPVAYNKQRKILQCVNFHHAAFDLDGRVVKGPAPKPLVAYRTRVDQGILLITL